MNDLDAYLIPLVFFGIVCGAWALPFVAVAAARILRAGTRHLDR